jgi:transposase
VGQNFRPVERDQAYLLPPSLRDWLPADDLAWFVLDVVDQLDLRPIYARYRADGWGAPAFEPALMTALLLYAYATGERSSRAIEARCRRDIAYRVIAANQVPDHATIARFRADHEQVLEHLFSDVLRLCAEAGLGRLGIVALDGTKIAANAALDANRTAPQVEAEIRAILAEAAATDAAEDAALGPGRLGDELPAALADRRSRLVRLEEARHRLDATTAARQAEYDAHLARRAETEAATGKGLTGRKPKPPGGPPPKANLSDPDSRIMKGARGYLQGYNGQAAVAADGLIVAADLTQQPADAGQLLPLLELTSANLRRAGMQRRIGTLVADAGYWSEANLAALPPDGPEVLIPPTSGANTRLHVPPPRGRIPHGLSRRARMARRLATRSGAARYRRRATIVEPVFGQIKEVRRVRRFQRRGFTACRAEWLLVCTTHNLLKLWRKRLRSGSPGRP